MKKTKFLAGILTFCMFVGLIQVKAEDFNIKIYINNSADATPQVGDTLRLGIEGADRISWFSSDAPDGDFEEIEIGSEHIVTWADEGKYFKGVADVGDEKYTSECTQKVPVVTYERQKRVSTPLSGWVEKTPEENVFEIGGMEFILLDTENNDRSKYFIMSKEFFGTGVYDEDNTTKFDVEDENNIAYWLNNDFLTSGKDGKVLPEGIIRHIDRNHIWKTEPGQKNSNCKTEYLTKCGVALMSQTEWKKYMGKFGLKDSYSGIGWFLRTARGDVTDANQILLSMVDYSTGGVSWMGQTSGHKANGSNGEDGIRPVFYLDRNFFASEKINLEAAGSAVKKILKTEYTREELTKVYTGKELEVFDRPVAENLVIYVNGKSAQPVPGDTLVCDFDQYTDSGEEMGKAQIKWYRCASVSGEATLLKSEDDGSYIVRWDDEGRYLFCSVTPQTISGIKGQSVNSNLSQAVKKTQLERASRIVERPANSAENTPDENVFEFDGQKFILLDTENNDKSTFFVMTKDFYGNRAFSTDGLAKFDAENENNIAYWLNHEFLEKGNEKKVLSEKVQKYIDYDYVWKTEPGLKESTYPEEYYTKCGVALLSQTEWSKYIDKFGLKDSYSGIGWWLRTTRAVNLNYEAPLMSVVDYVTGGVSWLGQTSQHNTFDTDGVRPVFHLGKSFFKENKLDLQKAGKNVLKTLGECYTKEELKGLYSEKELVENFGIKPDYSLEMTSSGENAIDMKISNNTADSKAVVAVIAEYSPERKLIKKSMQEVSVGGGKDANLSMETAPEAGYVRGYLWSEIKKPKIMAVYAEYAKAELSEEEGTEEKVNESLKVEFDRQKQELTIEGKVPDIDGQYYNNDILIRIFEPGKSADDIEDSYDGIVYYFTQESPESDGSFKLSLPMSGADGKYTAEITLPRSESVLKSFYYAAPETYDNILKEINAAKSIDELTKILNDNFEVLSLGDELFYRVEEKEKDVLDNISKQLYGRKYESINDFMKAFQVGLAVRAVNNIPENIGIYIENVADNLGIADKDFYCNVFKGFQEAEKNKVYDSVLKAKPQSGEALAECLFENIVINALSGMTNWNDADKVITSNAEMLENLDIAAYGALSDEQKAVVCKAVLSGSAKTIDELVSLINKEIKSVKSGGGSTSGGSSSGGSSSGGSSGKGKTTGISAGGVLPKQESGNAQSTDVFSDLESVSWAKESIYTLYGFNIIAGKEAGRFYPQDAITRAEFAKMLVCALNLLDEDARCDFSDVAEDAWYYKYVASLKKAELISGYEDGSFKADQNIMRQDMAVMAANAIGISYSEEFENNFADSDQVSEYAKLAVNFLANVGILSGDENNMYNPKKDFTRAEAAVVIAKILSYKGITK